MTALASTARLGLSDSLVEVVRALAAATVDTTDLHRREASLDDVFLTLTEPTTELAA